MHVQLEGRWHLGMCAHSMSCMHVGGSQLMLLRCQQQSTWILFSTRESSL